MKLSLTQLQRDVAASVGARVCSVALNLIAVPVYLRYLGAEVYGLIGVMYLLESISALMDSGLGMTLNRELARRGARPSESDAPWSDTRRDFLATLQIVHWVLAGVCGLAVFAGAPWITQHWLRATAVSPPVVTACLRWMSLSVTAAVLSSFYQGGLFGAGKQVAANAVLAVFATLRVCGCLALLTLVTPAPSAFFAVQGISISLQAIASGILLWMALPHNGQRARFASQHLREVWRFAAIVSANAFLTAAVSQVDRIIFSRALPLAEFGYYTLAGTISGTLWAVVLPLTAPYFPRLAELWEANAIDKLREMYHHASQLVTVAVGPLAVILAAFAYELLIVWTGDQTAAMHAAPIAVALVIGTAANTLSSVPSHTQNAVGWPGLMTTYNLIYGATFLPLIAWVAFKFGAVAAASTWAIPNIGYVFITTPIMHTRILRGDLWRWYSADVLGPLIVAVVVAMVFRVAMPPLTGRIAQLAYVAAAGAVTLLATFVATKDLRTQVFRRLSRQLSVSV